MLKKTHALIVAVCLIAVPSLSHASNITGVIRIIKDKTIPCIDAELVLFTPLQGNTGTSTFSDPDNPRLAYSFEGKHVHNGWYVGHGELPADKLAKSFHMRVEIWCKGADLEDKPCISHKMKMQNNSWENVKSLASTFGATFGPATWEDALEDMKDAFIEALLGIPYGEVKKALSTAHIYRIGYRKWSFKCPCKKHSDE